MHIGQTLNPLKGPARSGSFVGDTINQMLRDTFFLTLFFVLLVVMVVHALSLSFLLYGIFVWLDAVIHFGGGFWAGGMTVWLSVYFSRFLFTNNQKQFLFFLIALVSGVAFGALWEIFEVLIDLTLPLEGDYTTDTITDLIADTTGAAIAGLYFLYTRRVKIANNN